MSTVTFWPFLFKLVQDGFASLNSLPFTKTGHNLGLCLLPYVFQSSTALLENSLHFPNISWNFPPCCPSVIPANSTDKCYLQKFGTGSKKSSLPTNLFLNLHSCCLTTDSAVSLPFFFFLNSARNSSVSSAGVQQQCHSVSLSDSPGTPRCPPCHPCKQTTRLCLACLIFCQEPHFAFMKKRAANTWLIHFQLFRSSKLQEFFTCLNCSFYLWGQSGDLAQISCHILWLCQPSLGGKD